MFNETATLEAHVKAAVTCQVVVECDIYLKLSHLGLYLRLSLLPFGVSDLLEVNY